jgi:hypothetical protein
MPIFCWDKKIINPTVEAPSMLLLFIFDEFEHPSPSRKKALQERGRNIDKAHKKLVPYRPGHVHNK